MNNGYGMLWFDNDETPIEVKIRKIKEYYRNKYGTEVSEVRLNVYDFQRFFPKATTTCVVVGSVEVKTFGSTVLPNHFWVC